MVERRYRVSPGLTSFLFVATGIAAAGWLYLPYGYLPPDIELLRSEYSTTLPLVLWGVFWLFGVLLFWPIEAMYGLLYGEQSFKFSEEGGTLIILLWPLAALVAFGYTPMLLLFRFLFQAR